MLKSVSQNIVFTCIPLNFVHLLNYDVQIIKNVNTYID